MLALPIPAGPFLQNQEYVEMKNRLIILTVVCPMIGIMLIMLGWGLDMAGLRVLSWICFILSPANFVAMVIFSRCPRCGWPLIFNVRYAQDCPRCKTPLSKL